MSPHSAAPGIVRKRSASCTHVKEAVAREASPAVAAPVDEVATVGGVDDVHEPKSITHSDEHEHTPRSASCTEVSPAVAATVGGVDEHEHTPKV